jgi:hypothetical protein
MEEITLRNTARKWAGKPLPATPKSSLFSDPHTSAAQSPLSRRRNNRACCGKALPFHPTLVGLRQIL